MAGDLGGRTALHHNPQIKGPFGSENRASFGFLSLSPTAVFLHSKNLGASLLHSEIRFLL